VSAMFAIAKTKLEKGVDLQKFPRPIPVNNEVLIKVKLSGICGSDLKLYNLAGKMTARKISLPVILGHEFCGVVESLGPKVTRLQVGDRVAGDPHIPCMTCFTCELKCPSKAVNVHPFKEVLPRAIEYPVGGERHG